MAKKWELKSSKKLNSYKIFSTRKDISRSPKNDKLHDFYVIESVDWVNIVAITDKKEVVLIKQFRHGIREITIEIPGGMVDKDESPLESARRELIEETGYASDKWRRIGVIHPNPAIIDNKCYVFLAENVKKVDEPNFEGTEDIETVLCPISDVRNKILSGKITHSLVINAFHFYFESVRDKN